MKLKKWFIVGVMVALAGFANAAITYGFYRITDNCPTNIAGQLSVEVSDIGGGLVQFDFFNVGTVSSVITQIYIDDADVPLLTPSSIVNSTGTDFEWDTKKNDNLPGWASVAPTFMAVVSSSAVADNPAPDNGIGLGETVGLKFAASLSGVLGALDSGSLRIGLHVQAIGSCSNSDSFVNTVIVPAPGAILLAAMGTGLVGYLRRREKI